MGGLKGQASISDPTDYQLWTELGLQSEVSKGWTMNLNWQGRWQNNVQDYRGNYLSLGSSFKANKHFKLLGEYRYSDASNRMNHRFTLGMGYEKKIIRGLKINGRLLIQNRIQDFPGEDIPLESALYYRFRVQMNYKFNQRLDGYASVEPILKVGGNFPVDNWRNVIGFKYDVAPLWQVTAFGMVRPDYGKATYNRLYFVTGLGCTYSIKR